MMSGDTQGPPILWDVVEECSDEAEFLWRLWEQALIAPHYNLREVSTWVEDRLLGAIDGIRAGGEAAVERLLLPALADDEPTRVSAAACALALEATPAGIEALAEQWRLAEAPGLAALRRGVECVASPGVLAELQLRLKNAGPAARGALLEAYAYRQLAPRLLLEEAAASREPLLVRAALRAASSRADSAEIVARVLAAPEAGLREVALEAGLVLGLPEAWSQCQSLLGPERAGGGALLPVIAALGGKVERARILALVADEKQRKLALRAAAFCGTREAAEACVELLRQGVEVKLAADAFCTITGLVLAERKLIEPEAPTAPEDDQPVSFEMENLDAIPALTEEDALPLPKLSGVIAWWEEHQDRFASGVRYLAGQPASLPGLLQSLREGPMRRRRTLALELAVRTQGLWVRTDAFTKEQWGQLQNLKSLSDEVLNRSPLRREFSPL